jgi:FlaA1/EpsC-like NDP-sugar epimerase
MTRRSDRHRVLTASRLNRRFRRWGRTLGLTDLMRRRRVVQLCWMVVDALVMSAVAWLAITLLQLPLTHSALAIIALMIVTRMAAFIRQGMYRAVLRYSGIHTLVVASIGVALGTLVGVGAAFFLRLDNTAGLGRAFLVLEGLMSLVACGGMRMAARMMIERMSSGKGQRVLVYGAGNLGEMTMRDLLRTAKFSPVGFIDDNTQLKGALIHGKPVLGGLAELGQIALRHKPEVMVLAVKDMPGETTRAIFHACMEKNIRLVVTRGTSSMIGGSGHLDLKELALEDLLPRPSRSLDPAPVRRMLTGKTVMITGAGGSIGSELCRQIAANGARKIVLIDHGEFNLYRIHQQLCDRHPGLPIIPLLIDLSDKSDVEQALNEHRPHVVFHAAAYKHVPLVEDNPCRGVINNIASFSHLLHACDAAGVERLVQISTDKAVRPTNVMGATKRVCELLLQSFPVTKTRLCAVRFGNVLGSSGSVVPRFLEQIAAGGPVTVTHPEVTRYFMLIPEAVALVLQAGALADHGEIFILDMGAPVKIADMARQLIFMSGHRPDHDMKIVFTGLRPGEKLYEELLMDDSERRTAVAGITVAHAAACSYPALIHGVQRLLAAAHAGNTADVVAELKELVPEWTVGDSLKIDFAPERASAKISLV